MVLEEEQAGRDRSSRVKLLVVDAVVVVRSVLRILGVC